MQTYDRRAYSAIRRPYTSGADFHLQRVYAWARTLHDARIGIAGSLGGYYQYPLHGRELTNRVQYIGMRGAHGSFRSIATCAGWRRALLNGRYRYLITVPDVDPWDPHHPRTAAAEGWTRSDPYARLVLDAGGDVKVFALTGHSLAGCRAS
jgi:hypothetical protein